MCVSEHMHKCMQACAYTKCCNTFNNRLHIFTCTLISGIIFFLSVHSYCL